MAKPTATQSRSEPSARRLHSRTCGKSVVVTVVMGPRPSTASPCCRLRPAAVLKAGCRTHTLACHWSEAHQSAAANWSPIWLAPQTGWSLWKHRKSEKELMKKCHSTSCVLAVLPCIWGRLCGGDDWNKQTNKAMMEWTNITLEEETVMSMCSAI